MLCGAVSIASGALEFTGCTSGCLDADGDCNAPPGFIPGVDCSPNAQYCDGNVAVVCDASGKVAQSRMTDCGSAKCTYDPVKSEATCVEVVVRDAGGG